MKQEKEQPKTKSIQRSVVDIFVAKDRTAGFFMCLAIASMFGSWWYVEQFRLAMQIKPPILFVDRAGTLRQAPTSPFTTALAAHESQTRLAMKTIFERNGDGLATPQMAPMLFEDTAMEWLTKDLMTRAKRAKDLDLVQTIEVTGITSGAVGASSCVMEAHGLLTRVTTFEGRSEARTSSITAKFGWRFNPAMKSKEKSSLQLPIICYQLKIEEKELEPLEASTGRPFSNVLLSSL